VRVDHAPGVEALLGRLAHHAAVETSAASPSHEGAVKPVTPSWTISGTAPSALATTGVPHAIASSSTSPNGSG